MQWLSYHVSKLFAAYCIISIVLAGLIQTHIIRTSYIVLIISLKDVVLPSANSTNIITFFS